MAKRRVGLIQSFKLAGKASMDSPDPSGVGGFWGTLIFGFWWWITGVPEDRPKKPESG
jgi:hypothetical protein